MRQLAARAPALLLMVLALAGCTNWPPPGRGGVAELHAPAPLLTTPPDRLGEGLACEVARVDSLQQQSNRHGVLSGRLVLLQAVSAGVQREYHAGLRADAARSLQALRDRTNALGPDLPPGFSLPPECP